ncbi:type II toxin-antitoxin system VapC family toxin [Alicyclobacillus tolerans]|uniref:type II toxin-antitoxin system tRNA(fMet)-specific endonuclease VapC n=1 Tax=Alicyclobacillus tolerans TaxID=90970 RepID=UPI001F256985|nr:type II toxin-antitoxin system VapC family toxin [Alicyclobacillus tolerans]MCF8567427.1 type II toxin-antitoxin system VapC family toxin [Alicyclobacillus tolerans]
MLYMLDTNICIYLIKRRSDKLLSRMRAFRTGEIGVSVVTVAELQYGVSKSQNKERNQAAVETFLLPLDIADFSFAVTVMYGDTRAQLERQGHPMGPLDTMIAAHALSLDVPLVTNNTKEFERVKGLRVEDWTK